MTAPAASGAAKLPSLLLVEDSQITRAILSRDLSQRYTLHDALDGEQAWKMLCDSPEIELVVTDAVSGKVGKARVPFVIAK